MMVVGSLFTWEWVPLSWFLVYWIILDSILDVVITVCGDCGFGYVFPWSIISLFQQKSNSDRIKPQTLSHLQVVTALISAHFFVGSIAAVFIFNWVGCSLQHEWSISGHSKTWAEFTCRAWTSPFCSSLYEFPFSLTSISDLVTLFLGREMVGFLSEIQLHWILMEATQRWALFMCWFLVPGLGFLPTFVYFLETWSRFLFWLNLLLFSV